MRNALRGDSSTSDKVLLGPHTYEVANHSNLTFKKSLLRVFPWKVRGANQKGVAGEKNDNGHKALLPKSKGTEVHQASHRTVKSNSNVKHSPRYRLRTLSPKGKDAVDHLVDEALDKWQDVLIKGTAKIRRDRAPKLDSTIESSSPHTIGTYNFISSLNGAKHNQGLKTLSYCRQCLCDVGLAAHKACVTGSNETDTNHDRLDYLAICTANVPCCDCAACDSEWKENEYPRDKEIGLQCADACDKCNAVQESSEEPVSKEEAEDVWEVNLASNVAIQWAEENCIGSDEEQPTDFQDWIGNKLSCLMKLVGPARAYHCACEDDHSKACSKRDEIVDSAELSHYEVPDGPTVSDLVEGSFSGGEGSGWFCSSPAKFSIMGAELFEDLDHVLDEILPNIAQLFADTEVKRIKKLKPAEANEIVDKMSPQEAKLISVGLEAEELTETEETKVHKAVEKMLTNSAANRKKVAEIVKKAKDTKEKADAKFQDAQDLKGESKFAEQEAKKLETEIEQGDAKVEQMEAEARALEKTAKKLHESAVKLDKKAEKLEHKIEKKKGAFSKKRKVKASKKLEKDRQVKTKMEMNAKSKEQEAQKKDKAAAEIEEKANEAEKALDAADERLDDTKKDSTEMAKEADKKEEESEKLKNEANEDIAEAEKLSRKAEEDAKEVAKEIADDLFQADSLPEDGNLNKVEFEIAEEIVNSEPKLKEAFKEGFSMVVFDTNTDGLVSKQEMETALVSKLFDVLKVAAEDADN